MRFNAFRNIHINHGLRGSGKTTKLLKELLDDSWNNENSTTIYIAPHVEAYESAINEFQKISNLTHQNGAFKALSGKAIIFTHPSQLETKLRGVSMNIDRVYVDEIGILSTTTWTRLVEMVLISGKDSVPDLIGTQTNARVERRQIESMLRRKANNLLGLFENTQ